MLRYHKLLTLCCFWFRDPTLDPTDTNAWISPDGSNVSFAVARMGNVSRPLPNAYNDYSYNAYYLWASSYKAPGPGPYLNVDCAVYEHLFRDGGADRQINQTYLNRMECEGLYPAICKMPTTIGATPFRPAPRTKPTLTAGQQPGRSWQLP